MESWQFIQNPAGEWYWLCSNVISRQTRESPATFKTRMECVVDAMSSGYKKMVAGAASPSKQAKQAKLSSNAPEKRHHAGGTDVSGLRHLSEKLPQAPTAKRSLRRNRNNLSRSPKPN